MRHTYIGNLLSVHRDVFYVIEIYSIKEKSQTPCSLDCSRLLRNRPEEALTMATGPQSSSVIQAASRVD